jgi:hypothetical protein
LLQELFVADEGEGGASALSATGRRGEREREKTNLDLGGVSRGVTEGDEHDSGDVDDLAVDLEDAGGGLHLSFEAMGGGSEPVRGRDKEVSRR